MKIEMTLTRGKYALLLTHPKMLLIIACLLVQGHLLAPGHLNLERFGLGLTGVIIAVLGVYRFNEMRDFKGRGPISRGGHVATAAILIIAGSLIGVYLALKFAWWILVLIIIGASGMLAYNLARAPTIHNRVFYGLIWGSIPFYSSYALQGLNPLPTASVIVFSAFWGVVAVQSLWLWGPRGCRLQDCCTRVRKRGVAVVMVSTRRLCHSPTLTCGDRYYIPKRIRDHARIMINFQVVVVIILTIAMGVWEYGI